MKPKIQRHEHILTLIREHNFMTVEELAANLDVTPQTIRRDVQELSETGQLKRYHGGASLGDVSVVTAGQERRNHQQQEKKRHCPADCFHHSRQCLALYQHRHNHGSRRRRVGQTA